MDILERLKDEILGKVSHKFAVEKYDIGSYKHFNYPRYLPVMRYKVSQYKVHGMGNLTVLECKYLFSMKLLTVIITPDLSTNIPLVIIDFIKVNKKWISFFEFFDNHTNDDDYMRDFKDKVWTLKDKYSCINEYMEAPQWYTAKRAKYSILKSGDINDIDSIETMIKEVLQKLVVFVEVADSPNNMVWSKVILDLFIEDLIHKGIPASEPISKALGKHKAKSFFENVVFYLDDKK